MTGKAAKCAPRGAKRWWKLGFVTLPCSARQGRLALDAKSFIDALPCVEEVRRALASGETPGAAAQLIQDKQGINSFHLSIATVKKYLQLYRRFFLSPVAMLRANLPTEALGTSPGGRALREKIVTATKSAKEIATLECVLEAQWERIRGAYGTEKRLGGLLLPNLYKEVHTLTDVVQRLVEMKGYLGYAGYMHVPRVFDPSAHVRPMPIDSLTEQEKRVLSEFSETFLELIALSEFEKSADQLNKGMPQD
jgi:hypothetical protein